MLQLLVYDSTFSVEITGETAHHIRISCKDLLTWLPVESLCVLDENSKRVRFTAKEQCPTFADLWYQYRYCNYTEDVLFFYFTELGMCVPLEERVGVRKHILAKGVDMHLRGKYPHSTCGYPGAVREEVTKHTQWTDLCVKEVVVAPKVVMSVYDDDDLTMPDL